MTMLLSLADGFLCGPLPKDCAHKRRVGSQQKRVVAFKPSMLLQINKGKFIYNDESKQTFINLLSDYLKSACCSVHHPKGDADVFIVLTAIQLAETGCVLLLHHAK